jgi:hypothetical protein
MRQCFDRVVECLSAGIQRHFATLRLYCLGEIAVDVVSTPGGRLPAMTNHSASIARSWPAEKSDHWKWLCPWKIDICRLLEHRILILIPTRLSIQTHEAIGNAFARKSRSNKVTFSRPRNRSRHLCGLHLRARGHIYTFAPG